MSQCTSSIQGGVGDCQSNAAQIAVIDERINQVQIRTTSVLENMNNILSSINNNMEELNRTMYKDKYSVMVRLETLEINQAHINKLLDKSIALESKFEELSKKVDQDSQKKNLILVVLILGWISLIIDMFLNTGVFKLLYKTLFD